jgi:hypothetical protein
MDAGANPLPVISDDALHVVDYFADVSGNGRVNAADAAQVARVAALLDGGFANFAASDPIVVGDISGNGRINAADASLVAQVAALLPVDQVPEIPEGIVTAAVARETAAAPGVTVGGFTGSTGVPSSNRANEDSGSGAVANAEPIVSEGESGETDGSGEMAGRQLMRSAAFESVYGDDMDALLEEVLVDALAAGILGRSE